MPRQKDEEKRKRLLSRGKRLFADPGNEGTLKELSRLTEMAPSNLYTYFATKEELIREIIEKDWDWMHRRLSLDGGARPGDPSKLRAFEGRILSELASDADLCALIVRYPNAVADPKGKLEAFHSLVAGAMGPRLAAMREAEKDPSKSPVEPLEPEELRARSAILVLGTLCAVHFSAHADLPFSEKDILTAFRSFF